MKAKIGVMLTAALTSNTLRDVRRGAATLARRLRRAPAQVHYFHQTDDPYSHLAAQTLKRLVERYAIELVPHLVPAPAATAAPERERLARWSLHDAERLGQRLGLMTGFDSETAGAHDVRLLDQADAALASAIRSGRFAQDAPQIGAEYWRADSTALARRPQGAADPAAERDAGAELRARLGHYLGATFFYGGEWYWGVDRLHFLEERLIAEGLRRDAGRAPIAPVQDVDSQATGASGAVLDFFCSLRSPYTYLAVPRLRQLAQRHGARLRVRLLLPMVMRGLPVPLAKRLYIVRDARREADRLGLPFGRIADPVGAPAERGLALLHRAERSGHGAQFAESFLRGVFAEGIDAGSDEGLARIAGRAGLDAQAVVAALSDDSWRAEAARNRNELFELGLWGVPAFRVNSKPAIWGQDRLWMVEDDLRAAAAERSQA